MLVTLRGRGCVLVDSARNLTAVDSIFPSPDLGQSPSVADGSGAAGPFTSISDTYVNFPENTGLYPPRHPFLDEPGGGWREKNIAFPGGGFESFLSWQEPDDLARMRDTGKAPRRSGARSVDDAERLRSSRVRAKRGVRLACKARRVRRMWTLNTRSVLTLDDLWAAYRRFVALVRRAGYWSAYVAVVEEHPNGLPGHLHLHVAVADDRIPHEKVLLAWHRALGWRGRSPAKGAESPGAVRYSKAERGYSHLGGFARAAKIASYMAKYMAKAIDGEEGTELNRRRYASSKGVAGRLRVSRRWAPASVRSWRDALEYFCALHGLDPYGDLEAQGLRWFKIPDKPAIWVEYAPSDPESQPVPF